MLTTKELKVLKEIVEREEEEIVIPKPSDALEAFKDRFSKFF